MKVFNLTSEFIPGYESSHIHQVCIAKTKVANIVKEISQIKWDLKSRWYEPSKSILINVVGNFGIPQDASNAFLKMVELLTLVPFTDIRHFDNAALPGDFIRAVRWKCKIKSYKYDYRACSLIDSDKKSLCDRFNLVKSTPQKWLMNNEMNGDITIPKNQEYIIQEAKKFKCNLYTSDVGMPIHDKFNEETEHLQCNISQSYIGLSILDIGGIMIIKCFTLTVPKNVALINILLKCFKSLKIVKPITSKSDNSELYIVGVHYLGCNEIEKVRDLLSKEPTLNDSITPTSLVQCLDILGASQVQKIEKNIRWFKENIRPDYQDFCKEWINKHLLADNQARQDLRDTLV